MLAYCLDDVVRMVGVNRSTILFHHHFKGLAEPERVGTRRFYTPEDVERIRIYFQEWKTRNRPHSKTTKNTITAN